MLLVVQWFLVLSDVGDKKSIRTVQQKVQVAQFRGYMLHVVLGELVYYIGILGLLVYWYHTGKTVQ